MQVDSTVVGMVLFPFKSSFYNPYTYRLTHLSDTYIYIHIIIYIYSCIIIVTLVAKITITFFKAHNCIKRPVAVDHKVCFLCLYVC